MGKKVFDGHPLDILEPGIPVATKKASRKISIEVTDENIFIAYACGDKGIEFPAGQDETEYQEGLLRKTEGKAPAPAVKPTPAQRVPGVYTVTVDGKPFNVTVAEGTGAVQAIEQAVVCTC